MMLKGIDISKHQENVDFEKVKDDGINFVILRTGYSTTIDSKFLEYAAACKTAGINVPAVYHFSYATDIDGVLSEAKFAIEKVEEAKLGDVRIFFDFEYDTVSNAKKKGITLSKVECNLHTAFFCEYVKSQGYKTGVYLNRDYYNNWYIKDVTARYPLWLADYNKTAKYSCMVHQYSSTGSVNGISGNVDMDYWDTDYEAALDVLDGVYGNGEVRKASLTAAGYDYATVQKKVNEILGSR